MTNMTSKGEKVTDLDGGRAAVAAALRSASHALCDAANQETRTSTQRAFRFLGSLVGRWACHQERQVEGTVELVDEAREDLSWALRDHGAAADLESDERAVDQIASHAAEALPRIVQWLAAAERTGRAEAEEEAERQQEIRERKAAMICPECGTPGRIAQFKDAPSDIPINDGGAWLEENDGLTVCDACGHRWWVQ